MQVDNYTANEACKAFGLTISAVFERQLRFWAHHVLAEAERPRVARREFARLLADVSSVAGIDLADRDLGRDITETFLVANVVRHGDGPSCSALLEHAPGLWTETGPDHVDLLAGPSPQSERLRVRPADLTRYVRAAFRFWGLADPQPMAITDPPY